MTQAELRRQRLTASRVNAVVFVTAVIALVAWSLLTDPIVADPRTDSTPGQSFDLVTKAVPQTMAVAVAIGIAAWFIVVILCSLRPGWSFLRASQPAWKQRGDAAVGALTFAVVFLGLPILAVTRGGPWPVLIDFRPDGPWVIVQAAAASGVIALFALVMVVDTAGRFIVDRLALRHPVSTAAEEQAAVG